MPDPATRRYRGVIIGSGSVARAGHLPAFRETPGLRDRVELVACVDAGPDAVPPSLDGVPQLEDLEQLATVGPIDFIDICTPTATHIDLALWGLERGYHVLCEKPVALTRKDAERLARAARRHGRILAPCHQYRFNPVWRQIVEWLRADAIGRWYLAEFAVYRQAADPGARAAAPGGLSRDLPPLPWRGTRVESGGGVLVDHGAHVVYQLLDVAGPPTTISAWTGRLRHLEYDVEDTASVLLEYPDRAATMLLTWAAGRRDNLVRFVGEAGTIELAGGVLALERDGRVERRDVTAALRKSAYPAWFGGLFAGFVAALDGGEANGYLDDIQRVAAVLEAAYEAAATGRRLPLAGLR